MIYKLCGCGEAIRNKKKNECIFCIRDAELQRLARLIGRVRADRTPLVNGYKIGNNNNE